MELCDEDKLLLLALARKAIYNYLHNLSNIHKQPKQINQSIGQKCGAFVSLHKKKQLRGCIGRLKSDIPLYKLIQNLAIATATRDCRFRELTRTELSQINIEISVITPLKKINSISDIELGRHGVYIKKGVHSGTFLPHVIHGTNWNTEEFLARCSDTKAGLGRDGWKTANIYIYEAIVFNEKMFRF